MSTPIIDTAGAVRPGEELDLPALDAWLRQQLPGLQGQPRSPSTAVAPPTGPTAWPMPTRT
jgi:hypothetical protein